MAYNQQGAGRGGYPPQGGAGRGGYPPQGGAGRGGYPPQGGAGRGGYPPQGQHGSQGGYPPQGGAGRGGYPPQGQHGSQGGYPPQGQHGSQGGYPPQGGAGRGGYPPQGQHGSQGGYPPQGGAGRGGYPPQGGAGRGGYPPQGQQGGYPPQQGGYGQQQQGGNWYSGYYNQIENQYLQQLQQTFNAYDKDRSGSVAAAELKQMNVNGQAISLDTAKSLVGAFDLDGNGTIDFNEFACLNQFVVKLINAFHQVDTDRSGRLNNQEIKRALELENLRFNQATLNKLKVKVAHSSRAELDMANFIKLSALLAQIRAQFNKKNRQQKQQVSFSLEDLVAFYAEIV